MGKMVSIWLKYVIIFGQFYGAIRNPNKPNLLFTCRKQAGIAYTHG